jgi:catechol 2,3-dioxygenase-like lactoylglutathione lyase family enzyme
MIIFKNSQHRVLSAMIVLATYCLASAALADEQVQRVGLAKLIVDDLAKTQVFYESMFGMREAKRYNYDLDTFEESIMEFPAESEQPAPRLALFAPNDKIEKPLKTSQFPVVLIYTPEFDAVTKRIKDAGHPLRMLGAGEAGSFRVAIARDPSGNAVEIFSRPGEYAVGGSKLIVSDRAAAEDFYQRVVGGKPGQRYKAPNVYDEVLMEFGAGPFLALFEPKAEAPLPKSRFPVVAIYSKDYDAVVKRIEAEGLGFRKVTTETPGLDIIIARDPAGNAIEIIREQ